MSDPVTRVSINRAMDALKMAQQPHRFGKDLAGYSLSRALRLAGDEKITKEKSLEGEVHCVLAAERQLPVGPRRVLVPVEVFVRALTGVSAPSGGYVVDSENMGFVDLLRNRVIALRFNAQHLTGLVGNVNVPRMITEAAPVWLTGESTQVVEGDPVFGQLSLTPHTIASYTEASRTLLLQSSPSIEPVIAQAFVRSSAVALDRASLSGSGINGQPLGVFNTSGVGAASGTALAAAGVLGLQSSVLAGSETPDHTAQGYATTPTVAALLALRYRDATSKVEPLWAGSLLDGAVLGVPGASSKQVPAGGMVFGDWSQMIIAEWGVLEIEVNPYANFQAGIVGLRMFHTVDVGILTPASFAVLTGVT